MSSREERCSWAENAFDVTVIAGTGNERHVAETHDPCDSRKVVCPVAKVKFSSAVDQVAIIASKELSLGLLWDEGALATEHCRLIHLPRKYGLNIGEDVFNGFRKHFRVFASKSSEMTSRVGERDAREVRDIHDVEIFSATWDDLEVLRPPDGAGEGYGREPRSRRCNIRRPVGLAAELGDLRGGIRAGLLTWISLSD